MDQEEDDGATTMTAMPAPFVARAERQTGQAEGAPSTLAALPYGYMAGHCKLITRAIRRAAMAHSLKDFCLEALERSFGNAGYQRLQGDEEPGLWCDFDLAGWAREMDWPRQSVYRAREQVIKLGVMRYAPNPDAPGTGRLGWNIQLDEWLPLQDAHRRARYARVGAGRPKQQTKSNPLRSVACEATDPAETESKRLRSVAPEQIKTPTLACLSIIKRPTLDCSEAGLAAGCDDAKKGYEERKETKEDGELTLSSAADATAAPTAESPQESKRKRSTTAKPRELSPDHQYRVDLLAAIEAVNEGVKAPKRDAEWAAAGKFYAWTGGAPAIATVVACYEITRRAPAWDTAYLSLMTLVGAFGPYLRNPANYAAGIERKRAAAGGEYEAKRAQQSMRAAPVGRPAPTQPTTATVDGDLSDRDMARLTRYGPNNGRNGKGTRDNDTVTGPAGRTGTPAPDAHTTGLGRAAGPAGQPGDAPRAAGPHPRPVEDDRRSLPARSRSLGSSRTERTTRAGGWPDITELDPIGTGAYVPTDAEYHGAGTEDEPFFTAAARRQAERAKRLHGLHGAE